MKDTHLIEEQLDGALNALFLENYSRKTDEHTAAFVMEQEYTVEMSAAKKAELLTKLGRTKGGNGLIWIMTGLLIALAFFLLFFSGEKNTPHTTIIPHELPEANNEFSVQMKVDSLKAPEVPAQKILQGPSVNIPPVKHETSPPPEPVVPEPLPYTSEQKTEPKEETTLPYFDTEGLAFFAEIKEKMLQSILSINDELYTKLEPGAAMYKNREVLVDPFVMRNFSVTNLEYKTFLADLVTQGRMDDLKKALPKQELWKEYNCIVLAKNYFEDERYNDFPVVNISKEAATLFCSWLEQELSELPQKASSKLKTSAKEKVRKRELTVRLPYDHEWIYGIEAGYSLATACNGYNTIYDASEGLVDKGFYKRTSLVNKREMKKRTRMDELADLNRFGLSEAEIIGMYGEGIKEKDKLLQKEFSPVLPLITYPKGMEACSEAGHVSEMIRDLEGGMKVMGCCWKSKEEYLQMTDAFKKNGASPFIGFRMVISNGGRGRDRDPFW